MENYPYEEREQIGVPKRPQSAWYVWAVRQGRPIMLGGYNSEDEAYRDASMRLDCSFEVVELSTIDTRKAYKMLRKRMLDKTGDLEQALRRAQHNP